MYYDIEKIGARVVKLRKSREMKQEELANELGIGTEVIGKLERGYRGTGVENYMILANFFNVSLDYLMMGKEEIKSELDKLLAGESVERKELALKILMGVLQNI